VRLKLFFSDFVFPASCPMSARHSERSRTVLGARIQTRTGSGEFACEIRNLSEHGAKIMIGQEVGLSSEFRMEIPQRGQSHLCRIRWRRSNCAGVEFVRPAQEIEQSQPEAGSLSGLAERLSRLEAENARLRELIEQIQRVVPGAMRSGI
jgi:hypothetical protein